MLRTSMIVLVAITALTAALTVDALAYGGGGFNRGGFGVREYVGAAQDGAHMKGHSEIRYR